MQLACQELLKSHVFIVLYLETALIEDNQPDVLLATAVFNVVKYGGWRKNNLNAI
jgi:uncharacterized membrane protein YpjA